MKMRSLLTYAVLAALIVFVSCSDDEPKVDNGTGETADAVTMVGVATTFTDDDEDAKSRTWSVSPSDGATIDGDIGGNSINVTFTNPGDYTVTSTREFGGGFVNPTNELVYSVEVYDVITTVVEAVSVRNDGTDGPALTMANDAMNVVSAGQTVRYINNSTGGPDASSWTFEGGTPGTASDVPVGGVIDVVYETPGTYGVTVTSSRSVTGADDEDEVSFSNLVKAVAPLTLESVASAEADGGVSALVMTYNKSIDPASLADAVVTVNVTNMGAAATIGVSGAAVGEENDSVVIVTLAEAFLASDSIMVSYSGNIADATDGALADNFTDAFVTNYKEKTAGYGGFENTVVTDGALDAKGWSGLSLYGASYGQTSIINSGNEWNVRAAWGAPEYTDLGATTDDCYDGVSCMRFKGTAATDVNDMGTGYNGEVQRFVIEEGKDYFISVMVKVMADGQWFQAEDRCADQTAEACLVPASFDIFFVNYAGWGNIDQWELGTLTAGEWVQLSTRFTASETANGGSVTYPFLRVFGNAEVLLDNYYVVEVESR